MTMNQLAFLVGGLIGIAGVVAFVQGCVSPRDNRWPMLVGAALWFIGAATAASPSWMLPTL